MKIVYLDLRNKTYPLLETGSGDILCTTDTLSKLLEVSTEDLSKVKHLDTATLETRTLAFVNVIRADSPVPASFIWSTDGMFCAAAELKSPVLGTLIKAVLNLIKTRARERPIYKETHYGEN